MNRLPLVTRRSFLYALVVSFAFCTASMAAEDVRVPYALAEAAAKQFADVVFPEALFGPVRTYYGLDNEPAGYYFVLCTGSGACLLEEDILKQVEEAHRAYGAALESNDEATISRAREMLMGTGQYATLVVSARRDAPPVMEYYRALPPHYAWLYKSQEVATAALKDLDIRVSRCIFYSPFDIWLEFRSARDTTYVSPLSFAAFGRSRILECPQVVRSEADLREISREWALIEAGQTAYPLLGEFRISGVPDYDWSYGCSPTASADVLGYWDAHGYPLLIDYYFDRWDNIEGEWDYGVPNVQQQLAIAMNTDTISTGGTFVSDIAPATELVCNAPAYGNNYDFACTNVGDNHSSLIQEINGGHPTHWVVMGHSTYGNHSVCAMGWGPPDDNMICIHDTWSSTPEERVIHYSSGSQMRYVIPIVPEGRVPGPLYLTLDPVYPPGRDYYLPGDHAEFNMKVLDPENGYEPIDVDHAWLWKSPPGEYVTPIDHVATGHYHFYHPGLYALGLGWYTWSFLVESEGHEDSGISIRLPVGDVSSYCEPPSVTQLQAYPSHFDPDTCCSVNISYYLSHPCQVDAEIHRCQNSQLIRTLFTDLGRSAGRDSVIWDCKDDGGALVAPNDSYYVQIDLKRFAFNDLGDFGPELNRPCGMDIGDCGNGKAIYVADRENHKVYIYDMEGTLVDQFGSKGTGPGQFWYPEGVAICCGYIYVVDLASNGRIQKFDSNHSYVDSRTYACAYPLCLACGPDGKLYFGSNFLRKLDCNLNILLERYVAPHQISGICVSPDGTVFAALSSEQYVYSYDSSLNPLCSYSSPYSGYYADIDCRQTPYGMWLYYRHYLPSQGIRVFEVSGCSWSQINSYGLSALTEMGIAVDDAYVVATQYETVRAKGLCDVSGRSSSRVWIWSDGSACSVNPITETAVGGEPCCLLINQPNPFSTRTRIDYEIRADGWVTVSVYDVHGRVVKELVDTRHEAGRHSVTWDGDDEDKIAVGSGIYFVRISAGKSADTEKILVLR